MASNPDRCHYCGKCETVSGSEEWVLESGESISIDGHEEEFMWAGTSHGEICLCETCYQSKKFGDLAPPDQAEIHYQAALGFTHLGRYVESIDALHLALAFGQSADILASLGYSYGQMGDWELARDCYSKALTIDPNHFIAQRNLKGLEESS